MKKAGLFLFSIILSWSAVAQVDSSNFIVGNVLYEQGNYVDAIHVYEKVIEKNGYSAVVNYNLGNCYYKTGDIGNCLLNYERALLLDPGDDDIRYNIDLANLRIRDKIGTVDEVIFAIWWRNILQMFTTNTWAMITVFMCWLSLCGLVLYQFGKRVDLQKAGFYSFLFFLVMTIFTLLVSYSSDKYNRTHHYAIIMEPSAILKSEPNESSTNLSLLHEGLKIQLLDEQGDWVEIKRADGHVGWLMKDAVEEI